MSPARFVVVLLLACAPLLWITGSAEAKPRRRHEKPSSSATSAPVQSDVETPSEAPVSQEEVASPSTSKTEPSPSSEGAIEDPELAKVPAASSGELIEDQELAHAGASDASSGVAAPGLASEARLTLHTRLAHDLLRSDPREETWESTSVAVLETTVRRSENLRFALGLRVRYHYDALSHDVPDARAPRIDLDLEPTAGYLDLKLADGAHLQLGYQSVQLGRFDLVSASDVLTVVDLREGPSSFPEALEVAQLAARLDYDPNDWLSLRAVYVPFFTPHIISLVESDYGLFPQNQATVNAELSALGINSQVVSANLSRADREHLAQSGLAVFTPEADLNAQQGAIRATAHGAAGELSLTFATALEHVPAVYLTQEAIDAIRDPNSLEVSQRLASVNRPVRVEYNRFALLSLDGALDLPPVSLGFEAAYMFHRTLYTLGTTPFPGTLPQPDTTDLFQIGAKLDYEYGAEFLLSVELFAARAMQSPHDPSRGWLFLQNGNYIAGIGEAARWAPVWGLRADLAGLLLTGGSLLLAPRIGYELFERFEVYVGAIIVQGPPPPMNITPRIAIGTLYDTVDNVFVEAVYAL